MKSPFPGMDPYLELWWRDVQHSLCTYARDSLQVQLASDLRARIDERLVVETDEYGRSVYPDLLVVEMHKAREEALESTGVAVAEPIRIRIVPEPARQGFVQILDMRQGGRVITVIEFLSPSNKTTGDGLDQYVRKQQECRQAGINLVEIDLVRSGRRRTLAQASGHRSVHTTYQVCVFRATNKDECELYPIPLAAAISSIRVPLRPTDADVVLNLQELIEQVYRNGAYADAIDYCQPCNPPLEGAEAAWADALLRQAGKRHGVS